MKTITLVGIDGIGNDINLQKALNHSYNLFKVDTVLKITKKMTWIECQEFTIKSLNNYIHTDFCLLIQADGFIVNNFMWSEEFFNFDYIGALWMHNQEKRYCKENNLECSNVVGNGGFSLRSKKLLEECSKLIYDNTSPEDAFICLKNYNNLKEVGIKFADAATASRFSTDPFNYKSFGFHGDKNFINNVEIPVM